MILLAFDPSLTRTGFALMKAPPVSVASIESGSFASEDPDAFIAQALALVEKFKPDFVAAEEARKIIMLYGKKQLWAGDVVVTPNAKQLKLSEIQGGLKGLTSAKRIPLVLVPPKTWRKAILGNGNLPRDSAKAAALTYCARLKIAVANHDEAEAACIGIWTSSCDAFRMHVYRERKVPA